MDIKKLMDVVKEILGEEIVTRKDLCIWCGKKTGHRKDFCSNKCYKKWLGLK